MGGFQDGKFVSEFACRTKLNYLKQKMANEENELEKADIKKQIVALEQKMAERDFDISKYYEVTDLLNSMLGLLIFPEQNAYDNMSNREGDMRNRLPNLYRVISTQGNYSNSYERERRSPKGPRYVLKHMRNAASHDRVMILPKSKKTISGGNKITSIEFYDQDKNNDNWKAKIVIPVEDLEIILFEICDYLLDIAKWNDNH